ncbi:lipopolysaccharide biosynthesis protein [Clostridium perfringens]|uniref:lipopolysaccharide biosynthesis protein n=1 Tax=Clostridium perfringens TaxID=1502 RepID=UPI0030CFF694
MEKKSNLAKNTVLLSLGTIMTKGINLAMIPLFSSWLSTKDYGAFDIVCTYVSLLIPFITLANSEAIFRFAVDKTTIKEKSKYITAGLSINLVNSMIVTIILLTVYLLTGWELAIPFMVLLFSELFNNYLMGGMRAIKKLDVYSFSSVFTTLGIAVSVTLLVRYLNLGLQGMIYGYAIGYILGEVYLVIRTSFWKYLDFKAVDFFTIKQLIKYAFPLIPNNISWWFINVSDRTLISMFLGVAANGVYAIAYKIPNLCASIFNVFSVSWQEAAIDLVREESRNDYYNKIYNNTITIMISLCGGLLALNYFLFEFVFDARYFEAKLYSPILITSVIFGSLTQYFGGIQISLKRPKENGVSTVLGAIINVIIDLALIKFIGLYAAALSTLIANVFITIYRYIVLKEDIYFKLEKKTFVCIVYYIYLLVMSYICSSFGLSFINLAISGMAFLCINKEFLFSALLKARIIKG